MQTRAAAAQTVNLANLDLNPVNLDLSNSDDSDIVVVAPDPEEVLRQVAGVFPDICPAYLGKLAQEKNHDSESIINAVLLEVENGASYPKKTSLGKRKRETDPILEVFSKSVEEFDEGDVKRLTEYFTGPVWKAEISKTKGYRDCWYVLYDGTGITYADHWLVWRFWHQASSRARPGLPSSGSSLC